MRTFLVLLEREMKSYFYSPIAYIVLCFFLALTGFNAYVVVIAAQPRPVGNHDGRRLLQHRHFLVRLPADDPAHHDAALLGGIQTRAPSKRS